MTLFRPPALASLRAAVLRAAALNRFHVGLAGVAFVGLAVRVAACFIARDHVVQGDAAVYELVAASLANGEGFTKPFVDEPTAEHPPLWEVVLAGAYLLRLEGTLSHRLVGALIGTVTVVLLGLLGRRLAGNAVGLVAAGVGAIYPMLWAADITILSEPLYGALLVGGLLAAAHRRPVILGGLIGLAALTRGEALALIILLALPLFWRRWRQFALTLVACSVVLAPWTIRNLATFEEPVLISTNSNGLWVGANCERTYYGDAIGYWVFDCYSDRRPGEDESEYLLRQRNEGLQYMREHADRVPAVVAVRVLRLVDMWYPKQAVYLNATEGRPGGYSRIGLWAFWILLPCAVAGAVLLSRRRTELSPPTPAGGGRDAPPDAGRPLLILLAPVVMVVAVAMAAYGSTRLRFGAEPSVVVLAAVALVALGGRLPQVWRRYVDGRQASSTDSVPDSVPAPPSTEPGMQPPITPSRSA